MSMFLAGLYPSLAAFWFDVVWTVGAAQCVHVYEPPLAAKTPERH